jgi:hypothetical protein
MLGDSSSQLPASTTPILRTLGDIHSLIRQMHSSLAQVGRLSIGNESYLQHPVPWCQISASGNGSESKVYGVGIEYKVPR